jgi:hypothetical protein
VQVYKGVIPVNVLGKSKEEAQIRLEQFARFLEQLTLSDDGESHPSTLFVQLSWEGEKPDVTDLYQEETYSSADELRPSMGSGDMPQWSVIRYNAPDGYDPDGLAQSIMNSDDEEF